MADLLEIDTPAAIVDVDRMGRNIARMQSRMDALGVRLRPHMKTAKCIGVGARVRVLPNYACATGAQFTEFHAMTADGIATWRRFNGW